MITSAFNRPPSLKLLLWLYVPAGAILLTVLLLSILTDTPVSLFTRDPADITNSSPFLGVLSNLSVLLWCATAAICFFAFCVLKHKKDRNIAVFFLMSGLITSMLLLDDLFLLHERIFPQYFHWRQRYIYLTYVSIVFAHLLIFREIIFKNSSFLLMLAFSFFFLSIVVDGIAGKTGDFIPFQHLYEDGFKLFGLAGWLGYFWKAALDAVSPPDDLDIVRQIQRQHR